MTKRTSTKRTGTGPKRDLFAEITDHFIALIEKGAADPSGWQMPWVKLGGCLPRNASTGKRYRGINTMVFGMVALDANATAPLFATYKQWASLGCQVQRGEKGTAGVKWITVPVDRAEPEGRTRLIPSTFVVFHVDQVADLEGSPGARQAVLDRLAPKRETDPSIVHDAAERALASVPAFVKFGGDRAFYSRADDTVTLPERHQFTDRAGLYSTWCHELVHWTGHDSRLARDGIVKFDTFGSEQYAFEELVAELGATFLCQELGIESTPRLDHAQYLASWLGALRNDSRALWRAASQAEKATAYVVDMVAPGLLASEPVADAGELMAA